MFTYEPWTPPVEEKRPAGSPPKASIHEAALLENYAGGPDAWSQFTVGPRGANPEDPYDASIKEHTLDLVRARNRNSVTLRYKVYNAVTGEPVPTTQTDAEGNTTTADQVLTDNGVPAVIRFNAAPKRPRP